MTPGGAVTTSWDDGHPLDLRIAGLLFRYGIPGTFYIPRCSQRPVMDAASVRSLAQAFEVGAHTITHRTLTTLPLDTAAAEIRDSRRWVEDVTGRACTMFAPPGGKFRRAHLNIAEDAGLRGFRTVELLHCGWPRRHRGLAVVPTTLQVFEHPAAAYIRNALRRARISNLLRFVRHARGAGLIDTLAALLEAVIQSGGVLHLWGHSWEIEECGNWDALESMLAAIADRKDRCRMISNFELAGGVLCDEYATTLPASPVALP
jgi:peptidoglycan-N-acetylglucosamine deacetylase